MFRWTGKQPTVARRVCRREKRNAQRAMTGTQRARMVAARREGKTEQHRYVRRRRWQIGAWGETAKGVDAVTARDTQASGPSLGAAFQTF